MRSRSRPVIPADLSARREAAVARSEVSSPTAATWRWRIPVRCAIHSSEVASRSPSSALVTIFSGRYPPQPTIRDRSSISDRGRLGLGQRTMGMEACELLADLVEEAVRFHVDRDRNGVGEAERVGAAMALHRAPLQTQEDGAVVAARIEPAAQPIERAAGEDIADPAEQRMPEGGAEELDHQLDRA